MSPALPSQAPEWVAKLCADGALQAQLGLEPLDDAERERTHELWKSTWNQVPYDDAFHARCAGRIERSVPLLGGPVRRRRLGKVDSRLIVTFDPDEDDVAWLSLSHAMPSLAWASAAPTLDALRAAMVTYTCGDAPRRSELPRHERVVKQVEVSGIEVITRSIEGLELWIDDATWGSAYIDDPWTSLEPDAGMMMLSLHMERVKEQHRGRPASFSFRTLWSHSILKIEQHPFGLLVFDLKYRPASDRRTLATLTGDQPGSSLPADLPVDLAASLLRGNGSTSDSLRLNAETGIELFDLAALCALEPGEATTVQRLRDATEAWKEDERLGPLTDILASFGYGALRFEAAATALDPALRAALRDQLAPGDDASEEEVSS
jgi:hypothetical protein